MIRLLVLARQELREQLSTPAFRVLSAVSVVLAVLALVTGTHGFEARREQRDHFLGQRTAERKEGKASVMGWTTEAGLRAVRSVSAESVFVRGLETVLPAYWDFSPSGVKEGPAGISLLPTSEIGTPLDLEAVVRIVLGLLAILLGLQSVAGALERGTLQATLVQPIHPLSVMGAKLVAGAISLAIATTLVMLGGGVTLRVMSPGSLPLSFLSMFAGLSMLYVLALYLAGAMLGAVFAPYRRAAVAALSCWAAVTLIAPQLVVFGSAAVLPSKPRQVMERSRDAMFDARFRATQKLLGTRYHQVLGSDAFKVFKPPDSLQQELAGLWVAEIADTRALLEPIERATSDATFGRWRLIRWLSWTNPGTTFLHASSTLADTGRRAELRWVGAVQEYQAVLNQHLFDNPPRVTMFVPTDQGLSLLPFVRHPPVTIGSMPSFTYPERSLGERTADAGTEIAVLSAFVGVLVLGLAITFPKTGL